MKTMLVTVLAISDEEPVAECQGDLDLTTFELTELTDVNFTAADENTFEEYAIELEGKMYPLGIDFLPTGNEFMLMDAEGVDAVISYAKANPDLVDGEEDFLDDDDELEGM